MRRLIGLAIAILLLVGSVGDVRAQGGGSYVVQPGDTLFSIAQRFGVSASELATINGLYDVNRVFVGQVLALPNPIFAPQPAPTAPKPVYPTYVTPVNVLPPGTTVTTVTKYSSHVVRVGDTLSAIAARYGTTVAALQAANGLANANHIYVGQHLTIVRSQTTVSPQPRPAAPKANGRVYVVRPGDNLFAIAARYRRNIYDIARANGLLNLNHIYVGQALVIP
jgi:LysM repeat protein